MIGGILFLSCVFHVDCAMVMFTGGALGEFVPLQASGMELLCLNACIHVCPNDLNEWDIPP